MDKITEKDCAKLKDLESNVANKFSFSWLERDVQVCIDGQKHSRLVKTDFVKVNTPGVILCELCHKSVNYGSRGFIAINDHIKTQKHVLRLKNKLQSYNIESFMKKPEDGSIKNAISTNSANATKPDNPFQTVQMCDRVSNAEAMLLGFIAENSLPFTMAPKLVDLAKGLAKDTKALNHLSMDRTSASYKMKFGMGKTYFDRTVSNMKRFKFSLNMDESTSTNLHRVLTVLVSYFSPETSSVVVEHFTSIDLIKVDSATITNHIIDLFATHDIPWTNLTSVLMDSCNVMRGCKSGVEARLRDMAPHLLDIDGDTCHHIHNASKKLCEPFEFWVERLFTDIHNDVKWSTDVRDMMKEVATLIGIKFTMPEQFVSHRWLSCYDVAVNTKRLMDVYRVVYYAFMDKSQQSLYKSVVNDILKKREVSEDAERRVKEIQMELSRKNMTKDGQARKQRIIERLLERNTKTDLVLNFYVSVLPMLKSYIVLFETKEPLIHKLIDKQEELMTKFLACFIVPDAVSNKSGKQLMNLNLTSSEIMLKDKDMFVGASNQKLIRKITSKELNVKTFRKQVKSAYINCGKYMQQKLPLANPVLTSASAIDPIIRTSVHTSALLNKLPTLVHEVLHGEEEEEKYATEVKDYQVDRFLPSHSGLRIDHWWAAVNATGKYPTLCKMVLSLLSCFHGPQVESSFNVMGDILNSRTGRMKIETYSAIQSTRYGLANHGVDAVKQFERHDAAKDPVDKVLCQNLRSAALRYKRQQEETRAAEMEKRKNHPLKEKQLESKSANKRLQAEFAVTDAARHEERMAKKRRQEVLTELAAKRKK